MSDMTSTEKKRRLILFSLLGVALAVSILLASFFLFSPEKPFATASLTSARTDAISGKAGGEGSEEYNQKLKEHDARQANEALKTGESFIPTPVGQRKSVVMKKEDTPPPVPPVAPVRTAPVQTPRTDNTMLKRMMDDLASLDTKLSAFAVGNPLTRAKMNRNLYMKKGAAYGMACICFYRSPRHHSGIIPDCQMGCKRCAERVL